MLGMELFRPHRLFPCWDVWQLFVKAMTPSRWTLLVAESHGTLWHLHVFSVVNSVRLPLAFKDRFVRECLQFQSLNRYKYLQCSPTNSPLFQTETSHTSISHQQSHLPLLPSSLPTKISQHQLYNMSSYVVAGASRGLGVSQDWPIPVPRTCGVLTICRFSLNISDNFPKTLQTLSSVSSAMLRRLKRRSPQSSTAQTFIFFMPISTITRLSLYAPPTCTSSFYH